MEAGADPKEITINVQGTSSATTGTSTASLVALANSMRANASQRTGTGSSDTTGNAAEQGNAVRNAQRVSRAVDAQAGRSIQSTEEANVAVNRTAYLMSIAIEPTKVASNVNAGIVMQVLGG